jgi:hypothetical protein
MRLIQLLFHQIIYTLAILKILIRSHIVHNIDIVVMYRTL